jgi:hypothetical protein
VGQHRQHPEANHRQEACDQGPQHFGDSRGGGVPIGLQDQSVDAGKETEEDAVEADKMPSAALATGMLPPKKPLRPSTALKLKLRRDFRASVRENAFSLQIRDFSANSRLSTAKRCFFW